MSPLDIASSAIARALLALGGMFKALKDSGFDVDGVFKHIGEGVKSFVQSKENDQTPE
jgi:hypothetical protein